MVQITENTIEIFAIELLKSEVLVNRTPVDTHVACLSTCLVHRQRLGARVSMSISYVYRHLVFGSLPVSPINGSLPGVMKHSITSSSSNRP